MEGWLAKKGRRYGSRVRRYMKLKGTVLSNHRSKDEPATWSVSVHEASVTGNAKMKKIVLALYDIVLELFTETREECMEWLEALKLACRHTPGGESVAIQHVSRESDRMREDDAGSGHEIMPKNQRPVILVSGESSGTDKEDAGEKTRIINVLNRSFKVVRPHANLLDDDADDSNGDSYYKEEKEPQSEQVPGVVYEESPTSIIFKQFNFPSTQTD